MSTEQATQEETVAVLNGIEQRLGKEAANNWLWTCTPYPAGLPSLKQLEGRAVSRGELTMSALRDQVEREMEQAMANYKAST